MRLRCVTLPLPWSPRIRPIGADSAPRTWFSYQQERACIPLRYWRMACIILVFGGLPIWTRAVYCAVALPKGLALQLVTKY